jgi:hypothetical protein
MVEPRSSIPVKQERDEHDLRRQPAPSAHASGGFRVDASGGGSGIVEAVVEHEPRQAAALIVGTGLFARRLLVLAADDSTRSPRAIREDVGEVLMKSVAMLDSLEVRGF